ncbi:acyltransferase family protein [Aquipuribacter hungaricus]|uniref:Acyltransferase family protein n=1 Tax=Aquipuribacter hungaricus TaxID=545624 RepID=A0ABV7WAT2_9MICO
MVVGGARVREAWPDLAKGVCVSLVVLWHVTSKSLGELPGAEAWTGPWSMLSAVLTPFRIPLFFAVSGFFAARALTRPWPTVRRARVLNPYYLYALWLCVHTAVFSVVALRTNTARDPLELLLYLLTGASNLWYLYALAAYMLLARAVVRSRTASVVAVALAAVVCVVAYAGVLPSWGNSEGLLRNVVFFLVPALAPRVLERAVAGASWRVLGLAVLAFLVCAGLRLALGPWAAVPAAVTGVWLGTVAAVVAGSWRTLAGVRWVGRRTLPVYVLHLPVLALLHAGVLRAAPALPEVLLAVYPLVATVLLLAVCLALHAGLQRAGLGILFSLPAPADRGRTTVHPRGAGVPAARQPSPVATGRDGSLLHAENEPA